MLVASMKSIAAFSTIPLLFTIACDREGERMEEATEERAELREELNEVEPVQRAPASAGLAPAMISRITDARCARENRCGNVGPDKEYASQQACTTKIGAEWKDELNAYECPGGIDGEELAECLEEIKNEDCNAPFDTLGRVVACRSSDICKVLG